MASVPGDRASDPGEPTDGLSDDELVRRVADFLKRSDNHWGGWRDEARDAFEFAAGRQWDQRDIAKLAEQGRPPITIDQTSALVRAIVGSQINNRQEVKYLPRGMEDDRTAEVATRLAEWARQQCEAEDEETGAFGHATTCGMGWTELRVDYDDDVEGRIVIDCCDPFEMAPDPVARKPNLTDSREVARRRPWRMADIKAEWPDKVDELEASRTTNGGSGLPHWQARGRDAYRDEDSRSGDNDDDRLEVVEYQWAERVVGRLVSDPAAGERVFMDAKEWGDTKRNLRAFDMPEPDSVKHYRLEWRRAFVCGNVLLDRGDSPCPFAPTFQCITGMPDRNKGTWYGVVRGLMDPQRMANKLVSQTLNILNVQAKGGVMAEEGAIPDPVDFENSYARTGSVSIVENGALSGGKIMPKPMPQLPAGHVNLMQFAFSAFQPISGVNKETLGTADREQAGVLEAQRKQASQAILAPLFDSLRRYYKRQGRSLLHFIKTFVPPDKQIRVLGDNNKPEFLRSAMLADATRYDLIVDEAPTSPNAKNEAWAALLPLFPTFAKLNVPMPVWMELFKYSPVPASAVSKIEELMQQAAQEAAQQPQQPDPKLLEAQARIQGRTAETQANIQNRQQETAANIQLKAIETNAGIELDRQKAGAKARTEFAGMLTKQIPGSYPVQ